MKNPVACLAFGLIGLAVIGQAATPATNKALAARVKRDAARCRMQVTVDACDDAIRWSPSDPGLLAAYGDALLRAGRAADALRQYKRAVTLAPSQPGLNARIARTEKRLHAKRGTLAARGKARAAAATDGSRVANANGAKNDHFSNAAPETQSH